MLKWLVIPFLISFLCSCSFQASRPAPVKNVNFGTSANFDKGSITSDRYKVKRGDTLYSIAWGADKEVSNLAKINHLDHSYTIYPGQVLRLSSVKNKQIVKKKAVNTNGGNSSKNSQLIVKTVANEKRPAYVVTNKQQKKRSDTSIPTSNVVNKVSEWRWPVKGQLISTFSELGQGNKGIKIAGKRGELIKAAANGRVVYAGSGLRGYGNLIIIKHTDDYLSAYAHTDKILVKEKQQVNGGQKIATMGSSGASRVMLHFEIRYHGKSVDPLKILPKKND